MPTYADWFVIHYTTRDAGTQSGTNWDTRAFIWSGGIAHQ